MPMYSLGHRRHKMQYTTFSDLLVKYLRMVVEQFGPRTCTLDVVYWQVRQRGCWHMNVPGSSVRHWSEVHGYQEPFFSPFFDGWRLKV